MNEKELLAVLEKVKAGTTSPETAARLLSQTAYEDLGYAKVDHHRAARQGAAEVIFGQGKTAEQIEGIVRSMMARGRTISSSPGCRRRKSPSFGGNSPMITPPPPIWRWQTPSSSL